MEVVTIPIAFIKGLQERQGYTDTWLRWIATYGEKVKDPFFLQALTNKECPAKEQEKLNGDIYAFGKPFLQALLFAKAKKTTKGTRLKVEHIEKTATEVIVVLNALAGTQYGRVSMAAAIKPVIKILEMGYTKAECAIVIRKKCAEWKGNDVMEQHLTPQTLFNPDKFDKYLNQPEKHGRAANQSAAGHFEQTADAVGEAIELNAEIRANEPGAADHKGG